MRRAFAAVLVILSLVLGVSGAAITPASATGDVSHFGAFYWGGVKQSDTRYVYVFDRTATDASSLGLQDYITAMDNFWSSYPGMPYFLWVNDRGNTGACNTSGGNMPGYSLVLVCNGRPLGHYGEAMWSVDGNNHLIGESDVWWDAVADRSTAYTAACHEFGHLMFMGANHSTNDTSCTRAVLPPGGTGYDTQDIQTMLALYYSHGLGGTS